MLTALLLLACDGAPEASPEPTPAPAPEPAPTPEPAAATDAITVGPFTITPVYHGTAMISAGETTVWLDPWSKAALDDRPTADVVLITDIHQDHLDPAAIDKVTDAETVFVAPQAVADKRGGIQHIVGNGQTVSVGGIQVTGVAMYNLKRGPESGGLFHDKGRGNGYVREKDGTRIYFAGDTECTDEMKALTDIDAAFLPMNLPYTMPPDEAAGCVAAFKPARVIPYHYAGSDLAVFLDALKDTEGVTVQIAEFYPGGLPW